MAATEAEYMTRRRDWQGGDGTGIRIEKRVSPGSVQAAQKSESKERKRCLAARAVTLEGRCEGRGCGCDIVVWCGVAGGGGGGSGRPEMMQICQRIFRARVFSLVRSEAIEPQLQAGSLSSLCNG